METKRIEALGDGIFAIVMTLLILDIKVPVETGDHLLSSLLLLWPRFLTYFVSVIILGVFWIGHHNQYKFIRETDRIHLWINIVFYMFIGLIPFSAALLSEYSSSRESVIFYALNLILVGLTLYAHWWYIVQANLLKQPVNPGFRKAVSMRILLGPALYFLAILVSFINVRLSLVFFVIPIVVQIIPGTIDKWLRLKT